MSLVEDYCKEIIKELERIPVFLPGSPVEVGQVITFGKGIFKSRPIGSFDPVTTLASLGVDFKEDHKKVAHPYLYASKGAVGVDFTADANAATVGKGKLEINFSKIGATYFAAIDCTVHTIVDTSKLEKQLSPHKNSIDWKNCYIVTSVTVAKRALIMQSNSQSASLTIAGDVKGLQTGSKLDVNANIALNIHAYKDASFIKDWSKDVTVFFTLAQYRKKLLGDWDLDTKAKTIDKEPDNYELASVKIDDIPLDDNK